MVIMEQCDLKQLHLRPVRINYVSPKAKTLLNGPWITHVCDQDSLLRFYHPAMLTVLHDRLVEKAVLADEFDVEGVSTYSRSVATPWYLHGWLNSEAHQVDICLMPYSDEELAEEILFRTQIAYLIENVKSFWQVSGNGKE